MEQLVWSVDDRKYQEKNEKSLILEGWAFQRDSQPLRFLLTDPAGTCCTGSSASAISE